MSYFYVTATVGERKFYLAKDYVWTLGSANAKRWANRADAIGNGRVQAEMPSVSRDDADGVTMMEFRDAVSRTWIVCDENGFAVYPYHLRPRIMCDEKGIAVYPYHLRML